MPKRLLLEKNASLSTTELVDYVLRIYKNVRVRKGVNFDTFLSEVLNKDNMGKERKSVYEANDFLDSAYMLYRGKVEEKQYIGLFDCLVGFEFSTILYKYFSNLGASNISLEDPIILKKNKTAADIVAQFDTNTIIPKFSQIQEDMTEIPFEASAGKDAFEAKARIKVSNDDITSQLKLLVDSKKYTSCYGVILDDTSVSRDVVRSIYRVGAILTKANNIKKVDVINNVLNIFS